MLEVQPQGRFVVQAVRPGRRTYYIGVPEQGPGMRVRGTGLVTRKLSQWPREVLSQGIDYNGVAPQDQQAIEEARLRLVLD